MYLLGVVRRYVPLFPTNKRASLGFRTQVLGLSFRV